MGFFDIFKKKDNRFVFDREFIFEEFPEIMKCHIKYNELVDNAYTLEEQKNLGKCSKEEHLKVLDVCDEYIQNIYALTIYKEFYGKQIKVKDWKSKKIVMFDELFNKSFENLTKDDKNNLFSLVELKYCLKLPSKFYK